MIIDLDTLELETVSGGYSWDEFCADVERVLKEINDGFESRRC